MKCDACKLKPKCDDLERAGILPKIEDCRAFVPLPTNADRIRAMTDEELARECLWNLSNGSCPPNKEALSCCSGEEYGEQQCVNCWLDWLRQEADHE